MSTTVTHGSIPVWTTGDRLAKARKWADFTQDQMANRLGVGRRSIVRYEAQDHPPRPIVIAYSTVTGVPEWWFDLDENGENSAVTRGYTQGWCPGQLELALVA